MGMDPSAIVFYGYCWNDEVDLLPDGEYEWDVIILEKRGIKNPWQAGDAPCSNDRAAWDAWVKERDAEIKGYREQRKGVEHEFGCDIGRHGHCDSSLPHVYIKVSQARVEWGEGAALDPQKMAGERQDWDDALDRFLSELGIEKPEGQDNPQWWLVAYYG